MALRNIGNPNDAADPYHQHQFTLATRHEVANKAVDSTFDDDFSCALKAPTRVRGSRGIRISGLGDMASWAGQPSVKGSSETMRMMLLTFSLVGLQYVYLDN